MAFPPSYSDQGASPPPAGPALAHTPLLSFLVHHPAPSLVLPLAPLLSAHKQRHARSPLRTPVWSSNHNGGILQHRASDDQLVAQAAAVQAAAGDPSVLVGNLEQLNVKTPLGNPESAAGGDYFSLVTDVQAVSSSSSSATNPVPAPAPVEHPSPTPSSASSSSTSTTTGLPAFSPTTPLDAEDPLIEAPAEEDMMQALKPVYRNEAWRSLEAGTRRNSSAPRAEQPRSAGYYSRRGSRRASTDGDDILMGGMPAPLRGDSFGSRGSGSRGGSPLGTVEEEKYEMDTDDGESGLGSTADDEHWQAAYAFLVPEEQNTLLSFVLDCLEDSDVVAAYMPRPSHSPPSTIGAGYSSPGSVSPTATSPAVSLGATTFSANTSRDDYTPRWTQPDPAQSGFSFSGGTLKRGQSFIATSSSTPTVSPNGREPSSTPNVAKIGGVILTATVVPVPPGAHPPTGFVILTGPPPTPTSSPVPQGSWLPHRHPAPASSSSSQRSGSNGALKSTPAAPTDATANKLSAYKSPSAAASSLLPSLPRLTGMHHEEEEEMDGYLKALGNSEMGKLIREFDWSQTELGPISSWPRELKTMVTSILASPFRECILFGPNLISIYNDLYVETAGTKHPKLLGQPAREGWAEIWDGLNAVAQQTLQGETVYFRDHFLAMERHGFSEETYHTFSYAPFRDGETGEVLGILNLSIETSATVIAARRLGTVRDLVQLTSLARTVEDTFLHFSETALKSLALNPYDIPFAMLYTVEEVTAAPSKKEVRAGFGRSTRNVIKLKCRGSSGVPEGHPFLVEEALVDITPPMSRSSSASTSTGTGSTATAMDLRDRLDSMGSLSPATASPAPSAGSSGSTAGSRGLLGSASSARSGRSSAAAQSSRSGWHWPFEEACLKRDPVVVEDLGTFAESLDRSKGWSIPTKQAVVIPVMVEAGQSVPSAVLVLGVNAMNRYDGLMETFFNLVARHVAIGFFSVLAAEQDRKRADELVKLDRSKSNFFSSVSHELRTPLTLILGPLEDMLTGSDKDKLDRPTRAKVEMVSRHANRLLSMVNKLLDFSSIEGGRMQFRFRPVQIGPLTRDIAVLFRDAIERAKMQYVLECDEDPSDAPPVYLSPDLWEKVVFNLISNALKYSSSGTITVKLKSTRGEAVLSVKDTGIGIPQAELGKIFERFHRIEANSRMATGSGIGLALTLELVKLLGGQLEVESDVGKGSTFIVRLQRGHTHLPIEQVDHTPEDANILPQYQSRNLAVVDEAASWRYEADVEDLLENLPLSSASSGSSSAGLSTSGSDHGGNSSGSGSGEDYLGSADVLSLKNRTIVLVDDSRDLRTYMASLLSKQFTVVQFGDPREALEYINKHPPSLVLTDAMMPYLSGMELTAAVRRNPSTSLVPIIMVSAQAGNEARAEALEGGLDDYLVKPFQARELVARVRVHLQLGLMRVELEKRVDERTRALIESEGRNRALAERYSMLSTVSPVGVCEINPAGMIVYTNPRWHEISGAPVQFPLEDWVETVVDEDRPKVERLWELATKEKRAGEIEERQFRFKNGRWAQLEIRASADVGLPDGWVAAMTDITKQKELEMKHIEEVEKRAQDAEQTRINTEMFLDMSSHELRNPLSGVWQNAEVVAGSLDKYIDLLEELRDGYRPPQPEVEGLLNEMHENIEAVDSIILCATHQSKICEDILAVSKLNMGLLSVQPVPFELVPRMNEVLRIFEVECSQKSIVLKLNADPSIQALRATWVKADPARLHQILLNFLTNSIKYTSDAPMRRITVHLHAFESAPPQRPHAMRVSNPPAVETEDVVWVSISVEDSGRGLSEEELKRLFARFSQANPRSDQYGGSGLGLYVSKKLVELHSGFIEVESRLGTGSIFSFSIPAARAGPPLAPVTKQAVSGLAMAPTARVKRPTSSAGSDSNKPAPMAKRPLNSPTIESTKAVKSGRLSQSPAPVEPTGPPRVLVVEDNLINQKVLLRQLKNAGFEVTVANNGQEALDELAKDDAQARVGKGAAFAMVLMDIEMPVMGGLEAIQKQRAREKSGEISKRYPICSLTGNARDAQIQTCLEAGFDDVATKPYRFDDILNKIRTVTGLAIPSPAAK
ncbi:hypothetical protein JCM8547_001304 [Rhodosporidiobolus lusitaniae]